MSKATDASRQPKKRVELQFKRPHMGDAHAKTTWDSLKAAIHQINMQNSSTLSFEELYRSAYNLVLNRHGTMLYNGLRVAVDAHLQTVVAGIVAHEADSDFLEAMASAWKTHMHSMMRIRDVLMYVDRVHVPEHNLATVFELGLGLFLDIVVLHPSIDDRLPTAMLSMIQRERQGEVVDRGLLQRLCSMYVSVGQPGQPGREVYTSRFEKRFLDESAAFFRAESQACIAANAVPDFLRKADARLTEQRVLAVECLAEATERKLLAVVETEFIANHVRTLLDTEASGLVYLVENERIGDLHLMFQLLRRVPDGHQALLDALCEHVVHVGRSLVEDKVVVLKTGQRRDEPKIWVSGIVEHREQAARLLRDAFESSKQFQVGITKAFEKYVNLNPRSPEYISLYLDAYLKKGAKDATDDDIERALDRTMQLFRLLEDKDVFERYYKQHLSGRLLFGRSVSDDVERAMIQRLKTDCGFQFTTKLEGMFADVAVSADVSLEFKGRAELAAALNGVDFSAQVLTTTFWPVRDELRITLPRPLARCAELFAGFYTNRHAGRVLIWQPTLGTAELRGAFAARSHELVVSTLQAAVLLLFNADEAMSVGELEARLEVGEDGLSMLRKSVLALTTGEQKILRRDSKAKELLPSDRLVFNREFTSKLFRVKVLQVANKKDSEPQRASMQAHVEEDRKHYIEAAIVRVLKARKTMEHNALIAEVCRHLQKRFVANPNQVKKRVESLIEREYIERDRTNRRMYNYLA